MPSRGLKPPSQLFCVELGVIFIGPSGLFNYAFNHSQLVEELSLTGIGQCPSHGVLKGWNAIVLSRTFSAFEIAAKLIV
jgi:hypothetical protein